MKVYSLMLVKSESKRLPNKNMLTFNGKPMFLNNLEKCLNIFDRVYVSSDSEDILDWADSRGAIAIKRPIELCGDTPNIPVYQHAIEFMGEPDGIVAVQANSPNIDPEIIYNIKQLLMNGIFEEIMTCHRGGSIYGSVWGLTKNRLASYKTRADFYDPKPDFKVEDSSIDIHTEKDYQRALEKNVL